MEKKGSQETSHKGSIFDSEDAGDAKKNWLNQIEMVQTPKL